MSTAILVAGLGFGDETKGAAVDALTRVHKAHVVVRYSGGSQCGHNVVLPDGRQHCFAQFGSGAFAGAATHLSRFMLVDPIAMQAEAEHLAAVGVPDPFGVVTIEREATMITPYHVVANQLRELHRGMNGGRHGSCGKGVGEARADALMLGDRAPVLGDLDDLSTLHAKLAALCDQKRAEMLALWGADEVHVREHQAWKFLFAHDGIDAAMARYVQFSKQVKLVDRTHFATLLREGTAIFEGAQGVLLDETHGFHPHTTYTTTTFANALSLLGEAGFAGDTLRVGLTRSYATRHGAGPFPSERPATAALRQGEHNVTNDWQEDFRFGLLDLVLLRYAIAVVGGIDMLGVSHLDRWCEARLHDTPSVVFGYKIRKEDADLFSNVDLNIFTTRIRCASASGVDLDRQQALGEALRRVRPIVKSFNPKTGHPNGTHREDRSEWDAQMAFAENIAETLDVRLGLVANGPTHEHRRAV